MTNRIDKKKGEPRIRQVHQRVMRILEKKNCNVSGCDIAKITGISSSTAYRVLRDLLHLGILDIGGSRRQFGKGRLKQPGKGRPYRALYLNKHIASRPNGVWRIIYNIYLASPEWINLRGKVKSRDGFECQDCGRRTNLQVHHLNYPKNIYDSTPDDCITLCWNCHQKRHRQNAQQQSNHVRTEE